MFVGWVAKSIWSHFRRLWQGYRKRRMSFKITEDYRLRARTNFGVALSTFVDVGATREGSRMLAVEISRQASGGAVLAIIGPPGGGKSFLAQQVAALHCDDGRLVVWLKAGDYEAGRFEELVERAMRPYSAEPWKVLLDAARPLDRPVTVVVDGLSECPNAERNGLLQELRAVALRHRTSLLITSTTDYSLGDVLDAVLLRIREPDEHERLEILAAYGSKYAERISGQFRTPFELSIAAECESELDENASLIYLYDAYIRRFVPAEQLRAALRSLASWLHLRLRTSLSLLDASSILSSSTLGLTPHQVDEVRDCALLAVDGHRVRFRHDLISQFFAAEDIVRSAESGWVTWSVS